MSDYLFCRGVDSVNGDITRIKLELNGTPSVINKNILPENLRHVPCFNNLGYCKSFVNKITTSGFMSNNDGLYVKNVLDMFPIKVINLDRRTDRWESTKKTLDTAGITQYERFSAVDGQTLQMTPDIKMLFRNNDFNYRQGVIGCAMSHMKLWRQLVDSKDDYYIILEDDIELVENFKEKLNVTLHHILQNPCTELCFLGYSLWSGKPEKNNDYPYLTDMSKDSYMGGLYGYLISKSAAWKYHQLVRYFGVQHGIDRFMQLNFQHFQVKACSTHIVHTEYATSNNTKDSDIQRNYNPVGVTTVNQLNPAQSDSSLTKEKRKMTRVKLITDWSNSENLVNKWSKMCKENNSWNDIQITKDNDADYYVIINKPGPQIEYYNPSKTFVFRMEPWVFDENKKWGAHTWGKWAKPDAKRFMKVLTHDVHPNLGEWHLNKTYSELINSDYFIHKDKTLSAFISEKSFDEGHIKRIELVRYLEAKEVAIDIYGRANHEFTNYRGSPEHKDDGLIPYKYTIAVENNTEHNYFTEKLLDGILSECLVFYWGCPNITDYIDEKAIILLDLNDYEKSREIITSAIENDEWRKRLPYIKEAKAKILNELQVLPSLEKAIKSL
jgi:GR25 family glycosyltransferase involved in LPS biosynthesis